MKIVAGLILLLFVGMSHADQGQYPGDPHGPFDCTDKCMTV